MVPGLAALIFVDTHVLVAIAAGAARHLSVDAKRALDRATGVSVSPAALFELQLLSEIGRLRATPLEVLHEAQMNLGVTVLDRSFFDIATAASPLTWTRDPFDRMIVAHASLEDAVLVTKDATIQAHYKRTVW